MLKVPISATLAKRAKLKIYLFYLEQKKNRYKCKIENPHIGEFLRGKSIKKLILNDEKKKKKKVTRSKS